MTPAQLRERLESRSFYEVCQQYRHSEMGVLDFEQLKDWIVAAVTDDEAYEKMRKEWGE